MLRSALLINLIFFSLISMGYPSSLIYYNLYTMTGDGTQLILLRILPNGQIINPTIQYPLEDNYQWNLAISHSLKLLVVGSGDRISVFQIQSNGDLITTSYGTTGSGPFVAITPDESLVVTYYMYRLDINGQLSFTGNIVASGYGDLNPRGNPILTRVGGYNWGQLEIDYPSATITRITTVTGGNGVRGAQWTPDGSLALVYGPGADPSSNYKVWVLALDSTNRIVDTGQRLLYYTTWGIDPWDIRFTPDSKYGFLAAGTTVLTLGINTITGQVTDTGIRSAPPVSGADYLTKVRITPDNRLLIAKHVNPIDNKYWLSTAFLNGDGSISWTGYTFPYDATFAGSLDTLQDMELLPIYVTDVESAQWQLYQ